MGLFQPMKIFRHYHCLLLTKMLRKIHCSCFMIRKNDSSEKIKTKIEMLEYLIEEKKEDIDVEKTSDLEDNLESLSEHLSEKNRYISEICLKKVGLVYDNYRENSQYWIEYY